MDKDLLGIKEKEFISKVYISKEHDGVLKEIKGKWVWDRGKGSGIADYLLNIYSKNAPIEIKVDKIYSKTPSVEVKLDRDFRTHLTGEEDAKKNFGYYEKIEIEYQTDKEPSELIEKIKELGLEEKDY